MSRGGGVGLLAAIVRALELRRGVIRGPGENLFYETASSGVATPTQPGTNGAGVLNQGYVEVSNVNVAEELVSMIGAGLVDLGLLEPHAYPLEQLNEALADINCAPCSNNMCPRSTQAGVSAMSRPHRTKVDGNDDRCA